MRALLWGVLKFILFKFDAESVHNLITRLLNIPLPFRGTLLRVVSGTTKQKTDEAHVQSLPVVFGLTFQSRVGLAAGFDKNAELVVQLADLGFGFAEIGTVTPRPQPGNDRPRLFREPNKAALFNRMGFNNLGAILVARNLEKARPKLPAHFRVGVNLGKNKDTPLEQAHKDYLMAARAFEGLADYIVINVSSPNTPGLRSLQTPEALKPIVHDLSELLSGWKSRPPLLLKLAPEVEGNEFAELLQSSELAGINGWILTNTLGGSWSIGQGREAIFGGWSGGPLTQFSRERLVEGRKLTSLPIISVGGILSPADAKLRLAIGADLIQVYTGWIYRGPSFPIEINSVSS